MTITKCLKWKKGATRIPLSLFPYKMNFVLCFGLHIENKLGGSRKSDGEVARTENLWPRAKAHQWVGHTHILDKTLQKIYTLGYITNKSKIGS